MRIALIGAGRLATNLGLTLLGAGHEIVCVYSHTMKSAKTLSERIGGHPVDKGLYYLRQGLCSCRGDTSSDEG